ncbi:uncharacterized protein si:ch211-67e16.11 [Pristis pectinata]|uniref:uncharacterized protein si:ch211-67e16.11 n=1 Tax=Pristis pectinata TaxID=685728 RepID=UPI00223D0B59|nr:uncharacterized protein si:ch211-67e16.11 [Pristis pectinata]
MHGRWGWLLCAALLQLQSAGGSQFKAARLHRWSTAGLGYLKNSLCQRVSFLSAAECRRLAEIPQTAVAVYAAEPRAGEKLLTVLPDSGLSLGSGHDAVLTLDPSPELSFGHPLTVYFIDFSVNERRCGARDGLYLGNHECMTLALKSRCENLLKRRTSRTERQNAKERARKRLKGQAADSRLKREDGSAGGRSRREERLVGLCEIHFVPLVVGQKDQSKEQRLRCVEQKGFAACPRPLVISSPNPATANCELNNNTWRCHRQQLLSQKSCRMYQTCDHGVLLSGGWKEHLTYQRHVNNVIHFYRMLRRNGFRPENIKTFFAGDGQLPVGEETEGIYPATEKVMIRSHISYICRAVNCADSLVLYLNSPTRNDGTMLLWDVNNNGIADQKEKYTVGELLMDLEGCKAHRVFIFIDQSYSGTLAKKLLTSNKHPNVVLIGNSRSSEFTWASSFTEFWMELQPDQCLIDYILKNVAWAAPSNLGIVEPTPGLLNSTIYGGPCYNNPPLTPEEVKREYMGCQNLPTAVWYQTIQKKDLPH